MTFKNNKSGISNSQGISFSFFTQVNTKITGNICFPHSNDCGIYDFSTIHAK